jgi:hypothetical protein
VVYARTVGRRTSTFIVSGKLWRNSLIMQDLETDSLWSHVTGEALHGTAAGRRLEVIPSVQTTWDAWVREHPKTKVLKKDRSITSSAYESYFKDPDRIGMFRARWLMEKMPGKALVHGVARGPHALAAADATLEDLVTATLGEDTVVLRRGADGGVRAFLAEIDGESLELESASSGALVDRATGSTWDLDRGIGLTGPLAGRELEELPVTTAYWFAWMTGGPRLGRPPDLHASGFLTR